MPYLQDQYAALDLQVLEQVAIPDTAWAVLERGLEGFGSPDFENNLPVSIARFKKVAVDIAMDWARAQTNVRQRVSEKKLPIIASWKDDIAKLDALFFGEGKSLFSSNAIGPFSGDRGVAPLLHEDGGTRARVYVVRLGSLPTHVIKQADIESLPDAKKAEAGALIKYASGKGPADESDSAARRKLIEADILRPLPLGEVGFLSGNTKHCSAMLGEDEAPAYSAFFREIRFSP